MNYIIQRKKIGASKWEFIVQTQNDSDLEALIYFSDHMRLMERVSNETLKDVQFRLIDGTKSVISSYTPNPYKLAV